MLPKAELHSPFSCAFQVCSTKDECSHVDVLGYGVVAKITQPLPDGVRFTIYGAFVNALEPLTLSVVENTHLVKVDPLMHPMDFGIKELCAGMGGIGIGLSFLGATVKAACDSNSFSCSHLLRNHSVPVVQGSVVDDDTLMRVQLSGGTAPCVTSVGFPCQPFSSQGDLLGLSDPRSLALWGALRGTYLFHARACILECVPGVAQHMELQAALDAFVDRLGWKRTSCILDLHVQWPCKRSRWWSFMCPSPTDLSLHSWPADTRYATIGQVIPEWPIWPSEEEKQLKFTSEETAHYQDPKFGSDVRL